MAITDFLKRSQLKRSSLRILAVAMLLGVFNSAADAQVVYDDAVNGTASSNGSTPTLVDYVVGSNFVNGTVSSDAEISNTRNFYTFVIDPGQQLDAIVLDSLSVTNPDGTPSTDRGFLALIAGSTAQTPAQNTATFTFNNLGGGLYGPDTNANIRIGDDALVFLSTGGNSGGTGFSAIGPGNYTFVIQQTGAEVSEFSLDFQISTAVPEPTSAIVLAGLGLAGLARRRRR